MLAFRGLRQSARFLGSRCALLGQTPPLLSRFWRVCSRPHPSFHWRLVKVRGWGGFWASRAQSGDFWLPAPSIATFGAWLAGKRPRLSPFRALRAKSGDFWAVRPEAAQNGAFWRLTAAGKGVGSGGVDRVPFLLEYCFVILPRGARVSFARVSGHTF